MKPRIKEVIIVEGKYDKNTLSQLIDANIVQTDGFSIFNNKEKRLWLKQVAEKFGVIILTDSDHAGFMIRNHIRGFINSEYIKNAYIPDLYGKEKRKRHGGKEGKIGVEGMAAEILIDALKKSGATFDDSLDKRTQAGVTKADLLEKGIIGPNSREKRMILLQRLNMPENMSTNAMLDYLNATITKTEIINIINSLS